MNLELVTIGTELLLGFTVDTNGAEIARVLAEHGVRVVRRTSVGDGGVEIREAIDAALRRTGAVLTTGGLGPTRDDVTKRAVAELLDAPLEFDPALWAALVERFRRLGREPAESNRSQAEVPRGATVLPNRWGTAPGLWLENAAGLVVLLPGVPVEMRNLLAHEVVPRLVARRASGGERTGTVIRSMTVRTTGIPESALAERLGDVEEAIAPLSLAYLPDLTGVDLRLTAWGLTSEEAGRRLDAAMRLVRERAGIHAYGGDAVDLAGVVLDQLRARGLKLAVAESCTGGLLGGRLTEVPGSSDVFVGGVIAYDNAVKADALGVSPGLMAQHGAVSAATAQAMAEGAAARFSVGVAAAVTGIAGPTGGTPEKPVGTVWFATTLNGVTETKLVTLPGDRRDVRLRAVQAALFLLYRRLLSFEHTLEGRSVPHEP